MKKFAEKFLQRLDISKTIVGFVDDDPEKIMPTLFTGKEYFVTFHKFHASNFMMNYL